MSSVDLCIPLMRRLHLVYRLATGLARPQRQKASRLMAHHTWCALCSQTATSKCGDGRPCCVCGMQCMVTNSSVLGGCHCTQSDGAVQGILSSSDLARALSDILEMSDDQAATMQAEVSAHALSACKAAKTQAPFWRRWARALLWRPGPLPTTRFQLLGQNHCR